MYPLLLSKLLNFSLLRSIIKWRLPDQTFEATWQSVYILNNYAIEPVNFDVYVRSTKKYCQSLNIQVTSFTKKRRLQHILYICDWDYF